MKTIVLNAGETVNYIPLDHICWIETYYEKSSGEKFPHKLKFLLTNGRDQTIGYKKEKDRDEYVKQIEPLLNIININGEMVKPIIEAPLVDTPEVKVPEPKEDILASDYDPMGAIK